MESLTSTISPTVCNDCGHRSVVRVTLPEYSASMKHSGAAHEVRVTDLSVEQCQQCGAIVFDQAAIDRLYDGLRTKLRLLSPAEIRRRRLAQELSQKELADKMGIAVATISRWESGAMLPSIVYNRLLEQYLPGPSTVRKLWGEAVPSLLSSPRLAGDPDSLQREFGAWLHVSAETMIPTCAQVTVSEDPSVDDTGVYRRVAA